MGCTSSTPRVTPKTMPTIERPSFKKLCTLSFMSEGDSIAKKYNNQHRLLSNDYNDITSGVHAIRCPSGMIPPVCLSEYSFPLILSKLELNNSEPVDISLPVLSIHSVVDYKIACLAHVNFLSSHCYDSEDTKILIGNIIQWLNHDKLLEKPILLFGFSERYLFEICHSLDSSDILFKTANPPSTLLREKSLPIFRKNSCINFINSTNLNNFLQNDVYNDNVISIENHEVIFCSTSCCITPSIKGKFVTFLKNGGGILFLNTPDGPNQVNNFLLDFGLSYSNCTLSTNGKSRITIEIQQNLDELLPCHFLSYSQLFCKYIKFPKINSGDLDDVVTVLRYHIMACDERYYDTILEIAKMSCEYLESTNYKTDKGIAADIRQSILIVLLDEIILKTPPTKIKPIPDYKDFPGSFANSQSTTTSSNNNFVKYSEKVEVSNFNLEIILHDESWISTGLYLPAGILGIIKSSDFPRHMHVQIGSHTDSLILKQGPWKRWPEIVSTFDITQNETKVSSSFGGIVYIYVSNEEEDENENDEMEVEVEHANHDEHEILNDGKSQNSIEFCTKVRMSFENFTHYPRIVYQNPSVYEKTKNSGAPWGELCSNLIIITMLSSELNKISDPDDLCAFLDKEIEMMCSYISYKIIRPYRLVFDVDKVDDNISSDYPVVLLLDMIPDIIFNYKSPTIGLFTLIKSLVIVSLPENRFDACTETALGYIVATILFKANWPEFDTANLSKYVKLPPIYNELWIVHSRINNQIIPVLLSKAQLPDAETYDSMEEMWTAFIKDLCQTANCNLIPLLERARPIPLGLNETVSKLPKCPERILK